MLSEHHLTLQQEGVGGSAHINFSDIIIRGDGVITDDESGNLTWRGDVGDRPRHPDVVGAHASKLQVGWSGHGWRKQRFEDKNQAKVTFIIFSFQQKHLKSVLFEH